MDYFRAVLQRDELSKRALQLTAQVIDLNAANYTAWHFRRRCLTALAQDLSAELAYVASIAGENPKNYQIWYHRRAIAEQLGDGSAAGELAYTSQVLDADAKNYHAWSHRQWVIGHFGCWDGEIAFVERMLTRDVRNNSAWSQRWFVVHRRRAAGGGGKAAATAPLEDGEVRGELTYALAATTVAPTNQAPWSYIEGLMRGRSYADFPMVVQHIEHLGSKGVKDCPPLAAAHIAALQNLGDDESRAAARRLCADMADRLDVIRAKYWRHRMALLQ